MLGKRDFQEFANVLVTEVSLLKSEIKSEVSVVKSEIKSEVSLLKSEIITLKSRISEPIPPSKTPAANYTLISQNLKQYREIFVEDFSRDTGESLFTPEQF